jgi:molecular chaperone DnaJ
VRSILGTLNQMKVCSACRGQGQIPEEKCTQCGGDGVRRDYQKVKIKIPAGIEDGQTLRLSGQGEATRGGGQSGDLYLTIHLKEHLEFSRQGSDVISRREINFSQAALGDKITVNTIEGEVTIKIPSGTQSGSILKIKNKGIAEAGRFGRGDHLVEIKVKTPERLSRKQKKLVEELRREGA